MLKLDKIEGARRLDGSEPVASQVKPEGERQQGLHGLSGDDTGLARL
jgi:hypothetical protein